jgi:hypothetical protein
MFSIICGIQTQYKYKQYYEKQITLREVHRGKVKDGSKTVNMVNVLSSVFFSIHYAVFYSIN